MLYNTISLVVSNLITQVAPNATEESLPKSDDFTILLIKESYTSIYSSTIETKGRFPLQSLCPRGRSGL
jgi:hypothetical protein